MPPAEKATIARTGLVGQACAHASPLAKTRPRIVSNMKRVRVMSFSLVSRQTLRGRGAKAVTPCAFDFKNSTARYGRRLLRCGFQSSLCPLWVISRHSGNGHRESALPPISGHRPIRRACSAGSARRCGRLARDLGHALDQRAATLDISVPIPCSSKNFP
jgi:hypothetical protein